MIKIHPTAIVDPKAELEEGVEIGPYSVIGPGVKIGAETKIGPHVVIERDTIIGRRNKIFQFVAIGAEAQHLAYKGEPTRVEIGDENVIREFVTIHRGTALDQSVTRIGHRCFLMAYVHIAHDCQIGDQVIMASGAALAGHVRVGKGVFFGGQVGVHQFCRIGDYAFIGALSGIDKDVPPYVKVFGIPAGIYDLNLIGLRRAGFKTETIKALRQALKIFLSSPGTLTEIAAEIESRLGPSPEVQNFVAFIRNPSKQGVMKKRVQKGEGF